MLLFLLEMRGNLPNHEFGGTLVGIAEPLVVTIDGGASRTRIAIGKEVIKRSDIVVFPTEKQLETQTDKIIEKIAGVIGNKHPDMVGYGIAGEVAPDGLTIVQAGQLKAYGWLSKPIVAETAAALSIAPERVLLINDLVTAGLAQREADRRLVTGSTRFETDNPLPDDYAGVITAISTGTNSALYGRFGATNTEAGHWVVGMQAASPCGCGQYDDAEAWISGTAVQNRFGVPGKDLPPHDIGWELYRKSLGQVMDITLERLQSMAAEHDTLIQKLSLFGSVALGNSGAVEYLKDNLKDITVAQATYGDDSGLYGGYFAGLEALQTAA